VDFDTFGIVLLLTGPNTASPPGGEPDPIQDAHLAHLAELHEAGHLMAAGPFRIDDLPQIRGIAVFTTDQHTAAKLMADDPAVRAGRFVVAKGEWTSPADAIRAGSGRLPRSVADAIG
jgi:uncharacterized protein YciI